MGLLSGLSMGLLSGLSMGSLSGLSMGLLSGLSIGLLSGLSMGLLSSEVIFPYAWQTLRLVENCYRNVVVDFKLKRTKPQKSETFRKTEQFTEISKFGLHTVAI